MRSLTSRRSPAMLIVPLALAAALVACSSDGEDAPAVDLVTGLESAAAGSTVRALPGSYDGPLTVPAGVTVEIVGGRASVEVEGGFALRVLTAPGKVTQVTGLDITVRSGPGILVTGPGEARSVWIARRGRTVFGDRPGRRRRRRHGASGTRPCTEG